MAGNEYLYNARFVEKVLLALFLMFFFATCGNTFS